MYGPQQLMGKVNRGGPENWTEGDGLSTSTITPQAEKQRLQELDAAAVEEARNKAEGTAAPQSQEAAASAPEAQEQAGAATPPQKQAASPQAAASAPEAKTDTAQSAAATATAGERPEAGQSAQAEQDSAAPASPSAETGTAQAKGAADHEKAGDEAVAKALDAAAKDVENLNTLQPVQEPQGPNLGTQTHGQVKKDTHGITVNAPKEKKEEAAPPKEVIYVDEQGNPVPKPVNPQEVLANIERLLGEKKYEEALPLLYQMRDMPGLMPDMLERVLYYISDCLWVHYADNPLAGYESIVAATHEAMNANLRSAHVPDALLRLGLINVKVGNLADAAGYIVALYRRYPDYPGVAEGFTELGVAQLNKGMYAEAEQSFNIVLDKYPESSELQYASIGLAKALFHLKKYDRAQIIFDFISKRWPRYYIEDPAFLLCMAGNAETMQHMDAALNLYWLYINLEPSREGNEKVLLKLADKYLSVNNWPAAEFVYNDIVKRFPDTEEALTAGLRLVEKGRYESPLTYEQMLPVFTRNSEPPVSTVYANLAETSRTNPDAVLARLKGAMWLYFDKQYTEAMGKAADFIDQYPEHPDAGEAREIIWKAFQKELANSMQEQNYGRILILWNGFPLVRQRYGDPDPAMRYALAKGSMERGDDQMAFSLLGSFLQGPMDPQYGEEVFTTFFNRFLAARAWNNILDLGKMVKDWPLKPELRRQLDYAMALSAQNLNLAGPALAMWKDLAVRTDIPLYQRAYATYFLARDAEARKDIKNSYELNLKVIELFKQLQDERSDKADPERIKEAVASLMDISEVGNRIPEALDWVHRYAEYVPEDSPEYPGLRFREARLYRKLGDNSRAQALLEHVVKKYPQSPFAKAAEGELRTFEVSRDLQSFMPGGKEK